MSANKLLVCVPKFVNLFRFSPQKERSAYNWQQLAGRLIVCIPIDRRTISSVNRKTAIRVRAQKLAFRPTTLTGGSPDTGDF